MSKPKIFIDGEHGTTGLLIRELLRERADIDIVSIAQDKRKDTGESYGSVTVSIGVSLLRPRYDTPDDLIERADKALYLSKKKGRNRVTVES